MTGLAASAKGTSARILTKVDILFVVYDGLELSMVSSGLTIG